MGMVDALYYRVNLHRIDSSNYKELLDNSNLFFSFVKAYWYFALLLLIVLFTGFAAITRKIKYERLPLTLRSFLVTFVGALLLFCFTVYDFSNNYFLTRSAAYKVMSATNANFITNAPIEIASSLRNHRPKIENWMFMTDSLAFAIHPVVKQYAPLRDSSHPNICLFIMESTSQEDFGNIVERKKTMPFIDSLMNHSLVFNHAFANGLSSPCGFDAVVAGLPQFNVGDFFLTGFNQNNTEPMPRLLKQMGYTNSFYYAVNDYANSFVKASYYYGIENFYGYKNIENSKRYLDGSYGVYDHVFLQAVANDMKKKNKPSLSVIFNISTHQPYNLLPEKERATIKDYRKINHASLHYFDTSLQHFFRDISNEPWFANTIFVFVGDHYSRMAQEDKSLTGIFSIPFFIYSSKGNIKGINDKVVQQADISSSILQMAGYAKPFFNYGNSVFDTASARTIFTFFNSDLLSINDKFIMVYDTETKQPKGLYNYMEDAAMKNDLSLKQPTVFALLRKQSEAYLQVMATSLLHNKMKASAYHP
jgi:phosphoglycerol transferase MdoB-like AlkP superfamily enzyme